MHRTSDDVLHSSAVAVLCNLEGTGLDLAVVNGRLRVWPVDRLTPAHAQLIQQHRDALVTLVRICDAGVQERLASFHHQLAKAPEDSTPAFVFQPGVPYTKGICFSCGAPFPELRYGRCWRCSWAWRMAVGVSIPALFGTAHDTARVCA